MKLGTAILADTAMPVVPKLPEPVMFRGIPIVFSPALASDDFIIVSPGVARQVGAMWGHTFDEKWFCTRCGRAAEKIFDGALACQP